MRVRFALVLLFLALGGVEIVSATPVGFLTVGICSLPGAGVSISRTAIDWSPPTGGGSGCTVTGAGTLVSYTGGGPLVNAVTGTILDLVFGGGAVLNFMTFFGNPNLHFDLLGIGPGPANTVCATTFDPNAPACSTEPGSPFKLSPNPVGTELSFAAFGIARDLGGDSQWFGSYGLTFPGVTPAQMQAAILSGTTIPGFCSGGICKTTYSGSFGVTGSTNPVPEPVSSVMLSGALIAIAALRRVFKRA